jgi:hypothetical protein
MVTGFSGREPLPGPSERHRSPPPGPVAIVFVVLFCTGLYFVTSFNGLPYFPPPSAPSADIEHYFLVRGPQALMCAFFQFGSAIAAGIFTAAATSRLQFLGVRAAGIDIARFGGWMTAIMIAISASLQWAMAQPAVARDPGVIEGLYFSAFATGGVGFSVPFGLLMAGILVPCYFTRLLPRWFVIVGFAIALCGELSWLEMMYPQLLLLIPLARFPGFVWIIAAGLMLPARRRTTPAEAAS